MAENKGGRPLQVSPPSQNSDQQDGEDLSRESAGQTITFQHHHHHEQQQVQQHSPRHIISSILTPHQFISTPLYLPTNSPIQPQFDPVVLGVKRPRFNQNLTGQWKPVPSPSPSPSPSHIQSQTQAVVAAVSDQSSPSPTSYNPKAQPLRQNLPPVQSQPQPQPQLDPSTAPIASSSDTTGSPSPSSIPAASTQDPLGPTTTSKAEIGEQLALPPPPPPQQQQHQQFRKGKYVSPVWKPHEMLCLAKAWRAQYQGSYGSGFNVRPAQVISSSDTPGVVGIGVGGGGNGRGKTRADKDKEVAEFLKRHGVNRDAKTAGTKWDNMLGEFRKVYEWERGGEREKLMVGKSYFRLSPYERKIHRLPASFDEEVFEELAQFMGSRIRSSSSTISSSSSYGKGGGESGSSSGDDHTRSDPPSFSTLPPPPPSFTDQDHTSLSGGRTGQTIVGGGLDHHQPYLPRGVRRINFLGFDHQQSPFQTGFSSPTIPSPLSSSLSSRDHLRRIGRLKMIWEESVSLWADPPDFEHNRGRVEVQASNFLSADELTFLDDSMVACTMEAFEDGPLRGFSMDRFIPGQQIKVFGRRKSSANNTSAPSSSGIRSLELLDPTDYYMGCLRQSPPTLPSLYELPWHIQEPPPEELRFPLQKTLYRDLPQGKELFFTASPNDHLDSRTFTINILSSLVRQTPHLASSTCRDSFIPLWDDCINRIVSRFCPDDLTLVRKPTTLALSASPSSEKEYQWPNVTGFVNNLCVWRGEETDRVREGRLHPSSSILEKLLWTFSDLPYILGYYAVGARVTFCAFSRSAHHHHKDRYNNNNVLRSELLSVDLSSPSERIKTIVPCWRIACLLSLLADKFVAATTTKRAATASTSPSSMIFSDFERVDLGNGNLIEMTPYTVTRSYTSNREWLAVKEVYEILDGRVPHSENIFSYSVEDLSISFRPRGVKAKPRDCDELIEALKHVTKALVALHDLCFMHRDLSWDKVMKRCFVVDDDEAAGEGEWVLCGFEEAVTAPQIKPNSSTVASAASGEEQWGGHRAPEMGRGGSVYGVKVDIWGVGYLVKTSGLGLALPKQLKELEKRCLVESPEQRPTAADCYHHLLQFQASATPAAAGSAVASGEEEEGY